jgi:hypothetical protein
MTAASMPGTKLVNNLRWFMKVGNPILKPARAVGDCLTNTFSQTPDEK